MLRDRMDVERIAKLVEAQGGFRTFAVVRGWCGCRVKMVQASAVRDSII